MAERVAIERVRNHSGDAHGERRRVRAGRLSRDGRFAIADGGAAIRQRAGDVRLWRSSVGDEYHRGWEFVFVQADRRTGNVVLGGGGRTGSGYACDRNGRSVS